MSIFNSTLWFFIILWSVLGALHAAYRFDKQHEIKSFKKKVIVFLVEGPLVWMAVPILLALGLISNFVLDTVSPYFSRFEDWYRK